MLGFERKLYPVALIVRVDEAEGMTAEAVHVPVRAGYAAVAHDDSHLVQCFGQQRPEIPVVGGAAQVGLGITLDCVVQVGKLQRIAQEEYRRVVTHQVPVAFFRVKLDRKAADIAFRIGRAALARYRRKTQNQIRLLAYFREYFGPGVTRNVMGHRKSAIRRRTFGMHAPLGNDLAVEVRQLF